MVYARGLLASLCMRSQSSVALYHRKLCEVVRRTLFFKLYVYVYIRTIPSRSIFPQLEGCSPEKLRQSFDWWKRCSAEKLFFWISFSRKSSCIFDLSPVYCIQVNTIEPFSKLLQMHFAGEQVDRYKVVQPKGFEKKRYYASAAALSKGMILIFYGHK